MKKILLILVVFASASCFAQTNVSLTIDHQINGEPFNWSTVATNNLDTDLLFTRLEYYLSGFSVTHDGGVVTSFDEVYALVQGDETPTINLGEINADNIEMISFRVGVDQPNNNADPASWPPSAPLAPKNPSMHWGWISGYRFVAVEGIILSNEQVFSIHGLGNVNYFQVDLALEMAVEGDELNVFVEAATENLLYGLILSGVVFSHGEEGYAQETLINMSERVFTFSSATLSVDEQNEVLEFSLFPNPADNGTVQLNFEGKAGDLYNLVVLDIQGKTILQRNQVNSGYQLDVNGLNEGLYLLSLYNDATLRGVKKLVVRKN
jgi:hypothetical protein